MVDPNYDFSGYATKNDIVCGDGRTIKKDAFKHQNGTRVPLVWMHVHSTVSEVLGHALLENREDGVYAYCYLNDTDAANDARKLVKHDDVDSLSIWANELLEKGSAVVHGMIREVSLVLSGSNPGARIDNLSFAHSDGSVYESDDEAIIIQHSPIDKPGAVVSHATDGGEETVQEILDSLTPIQKDVVYALIGQVVSEDLTDDNVEHSDIKENEIVMKKNVFDQNGTNNQASLGRKYLTHDQFSEVMDSAKQIGSLKQSVISHAVTYGIENIDYLFPDAQAVTSQPGFIKRDTEWVSMVLNATKRTPFSRIKTVFADITEDSARALGYPVKGQFKKDEFFKLMKRVTTPTTVYKKQKLDRDDIVDIVDFDVVAWLKVEMRMQLEEEIARAELIGDGRAADSDDKILEANFRPIWKDDDLYAHKVQFESDETSEEIEDGIIGEMDNYKGSGSPVLYTTRAFLNSFLLRRDTTGRRIYKNKAEVADALGVSDIVIVPPMASQSRTTGTGATLKTWKLLGIIANLRDYTIGADKGGQTSFFDDFDIDYNQQKYLLETRLSGALTLPKSALVLEQEVVTPAEG